MSGRTIPRAGRLPLSRVLAALIAVGLGAAWSGPAASAEEAAPLRVCADPDNLPFTSRNDAAPGFYLDVARLLAQQLGRTMQPVWASTYSPHRMLRTTLLAHECDMFPGVPFEPGGSAGPVLLSAPVIDMGYALVTPAGSGIADVAGLSGKRVAVQFGTPPQAMLAARPDVDPVTVTSPEEGMRALRDRRVDAALLWGPSVGYMNVAIAGAAYRIVPLTGDGMHFQAAIAFARDSGALRDRINALLGTDGGQIRALAAHYGFPSAADAASVHPVAAGFGEDLHIPTITRDAPNPTAPSPAGGDSTSSFGFGEGLHVPTITKDAPNPTAPPELSHEQGQAHPAAANAAASARATAAPQATDPARVREGRDVFNSTCAHCHGPDAVQAERRINLRLLHHRYGDSMDQVFFTTVTHGRPNKGMPNWSGVFTEDQFRSILAFLRTVQEEQ